MTRYAKKKAPRSRARRAPLKSRRKTARKSYVPRALGSDGTKIVLGSYFEVTNKNAAGLAEGTNFMSYNIACTPNGEIKAECGSGGQNIALGSGAGDAFAGVGQPGTLATQGSVDKALLIPPQFATYRDLFRECRVDWVKITVVVDPECGVEAPIFTCTDKGVSSCIQTSAAANTGAHKMTLCNAAKRIVTYGWSPKTALDKEFHNTSSTPVIPDAGSYKLKIFQKLENETQNQRCTHMVTVKVGMSFRDSRNVLGQ